MPLARGTVYSNSVSERQAGPGDILASGESLAALATVGAGTWTGAIIAAGIIRRTGPAGAYVDTTDTAQNILAALAGNDFALNVIPGTTFRLLFQNTVAFAMTFAAGRGVVTGVGTLNGTASLVREYLMTILNSTPEVALSSGTTNASAAVTLDVPQPMGTVTPGMLVTGVGITVGTRVAGVVTGDTVNRKNMDKITGVTLDQNATATAASGVQLTFSPVIKIDGLRESTL